MTDFMMISIDPHATSVRIEAIVAGELPGAI
jgi:hypothetical protein